MLGYVPTAELITTADNYQKGVGTLGTMLAEEKAKMADPAFMYTLGGRLMAWNRLDDADMRFGAVVKLDPENKSGKADDALLDRAWAARKKENWDAAVAFAKDCYNRWPQGEKAAEAFIYIAYYSEKGGKKDDAIAAYKEYLKKWPEGEDAEFAKDQLTELEKPAATTPGQGGSQ